MRSKYGFWIMIIGLTLLVGISVSAQTNTVTCPTLVQESFTATEFLCETVPDGQACIGNGVASTTPIEGATVQFANPGEFATLADIQRLQVQTLNTDTLAWTSVTGKLSVTTPKGEPQVVEMLVFGDAVVSNALADDATPVSSGILQASVAAGGGVIVRQDSRVDSNNIWQLLNGESLQAIGRSADNQWVRIIIPSPNGGAGWVFGQFVTIEGGRELLPFQTNSSPVPASSGVQTEVTLKPMQAFRLESVLTDPSCADTPHSGVMLQSESLDNRALLDVNGVELRLKGTAYITAQLADKMTIYLLEGEMRVTVDGDRKDMTAGTITEIPLDASLAPSGTASALTGISQEAVDLLVFLPIRLLSRNFEISANSAGTTTITDTTTTTDTSTTTEQQAPPPPAATPVPAEEIPEGVECPTLVQESYTATEFLCEGLNPNKACLGNAGVNMITAIAKDGVDNFSFANPGDNVLATDINMLTTRVFDEADNIWNSIVMTLDTKTTTGATTQATMLVFGEVTLENKGEDPATTDEAAVAVPVQPTTAPPPPATTTDTTTADGISATIEAPGPVVVRAEPRVDTDTIGQVQDGDTVTALGRSVDQTWVQVTSADGLTGWVFVQFAIVEGGIETLPIIDPNVTTTTTTTTAPPPPPPPPTTNQQTAPPAAPTGNTVSGDDVPEFTSMQAFDFESNGVASDCPNTPSGGIIIQSPDDIDGSMRMLINGVTFNINGTVYLRASRNENMNIVGLEGEAIVTVQETSQTIEAGQQGTVALINGLEPTGVPSIPGDYSDKNGQRFLFLPIRLLPRSFEVIAPDAPPETAVVDGGSSTNSSTSSSSDNSDVFQVGGTTVDFSAICEISAGDQVRNLRADAGKEFDVLNVLQVGETIEAVTQKRGTDKVYWYETARGWIRSDAGVPTANCTVLPLHGVIYDTSGSGGNVAAVEAVAPPAPAQPTAPPPPPVTSDGYGNVCESGNFAVSTEVETSGSPFVEFGGVWTGQAGKSATFTAEVPYYRPELQNILTFVNEDGSPWLGSLDGSVFTISFDSNRRFRVRVGALLGDFITLRVNC
jgi:uncharacterized protein YgiM (DUF1202 family)